MAIRSWPRVSEAHFTSALSSTKGNPAYNIPICVSLQTEGNWFDPSCVRTGLYQNLVGPGEFPVAEGNTKTAACSFAQGLAHLAAGGYLMRAWCLIPTVLTRPKGLLGPVR